MLNPSMVETILRSSFDQQDVKSEHGWKDSRKLFQSKPDEAISRSGEEEASAYKTWQVIWIDPSYNHGQKSWNISALLALLRARQMRIQLHLANPFPYPTYVELVPTNSPVVNIVLGGEGEQQRG